MGRVTGSPPGGGRFAAGRRRALLACLLTAVTAVSGCSPARSGAGRAGDDTAAPTVTTSAHAAAPDRTTAVSAALALDTLLVRREQAVLERDAEAFTATVADPTSAAGGRQLAAFRSARDLGMSRLTHDPVRPVLDAGGALTVSVRYRVRGIDRADRTTAVRYRLARGRDGWRVAAEDPVGGDAAAPWLAMPGMRVERGERAVVAGTAEDGALVESVATVDRMLPVLAGHWEGTPDRVLVLVPRTEAQTDALLGRTTPVVGEVAATTEGPIGAGGLPTGDRVVLDADARARLTPTGREVVLAHELAHVAVRATLPGTAPAWLSEGYADHVGYARANLPVADLAAPLIRAVRTGRGPTDLPGGAELDPQQRDIEVGYLAAWQAVELVVAQTGEASVRALLRACTVVGGEAAADLACDAAMPRVIGRTRAELTREWQQRLADLAR